MWSETIHRNVLRTLHNPKKKPPRNVSKAILKNFIKFPRVLFYFLLLKALHHEWSWKFSRIFQNSCFKEHIRTAASEIIWGNRRDGFLFHRCSRPEIFSSLEKIRENSQEKICVGVLFLILTTKTFYDG